MFFSLQAIPIPPDPMYYIAVIPLRRSGAFDFYLTVIVTVNVITLPATGLYDGVVVSIH